jgi:hypothetical protein
MFVMRRADGHLFDEEIDGKRIVPLWSNEDALARYKERNPELLTYLPARLTRSMITLLGSEDQHAAGFLLMSEDDPDADLDEGKPIPLNAITLESEQTPQPA